MMKTILPILIALLNLSYSSNAIEFDFCVADKNLPHGPTGYACKDPSNVKPEDFVFSSLRKPANTANVFKSGAVPAFVTQFPALNGMGISMVRADMAVGGAVPLHTHRVAELIIVIEGTIGAGFIDTNNTAYYKVLEKGDMMIIPPTLEHFQVNVGDVPAVGYASFASSNPGLQPVSNALFQTNLPTEIVSRVTLLDRAQVKKLKQVFGGRN